MALDYSLPFIASGIDANPSSLPVSVEPRGREKKLVILDILFRVVWDGNWTSGRLLLHPIQPMPSLLEREGWEAELGVGGSLDTMEWPKLDTVVAVAP
jgi:hypothetical protein